MRTVKVNLYVNGVFFAKKRASDNVIDTTLVNLTFPCASSISV